MTNPAAGIPLGKITPSPKAEEPKIAVVVQGEAARRKKPLGRKLKELFIGSDSKSVGNYVFFDIMLPAAKNIIADVVSQGIEHLLFGQARSVSRRTGGRSEGILGRVQYNRMYDPRSARGPERPTMSYRARATHDFDEIILPTRGEAEAVIDQMFEVLSKYNELTVANLYEMCNISAEHTDEKWGWTDLRGAGISRVANGYLLDLPRPDPLV